jgi:hypothetical protein
MSVQRDGEVEVQARLDRLRIDWCRRDHDRSRRHDDRRALVDDAPRRLDIAPVLVLFDLLVVFAAPLLITPMIVVVGLGTHRKEDTGTRDRGGQDGLPHKSSHYSLLKQHGMTAACRPNRAGYVSGCDGMEEFVGRLRGNIWGLNEPEPQKARLGETKKHVVIERRRQPSIGSIRHALAD